MKLKINPFGLIIVAIIGVAAFGKISESANVDKGFSADGLTEYTEDSNLKDRYIMEVPYYGYALEEDCYYDKSDSALITVDDFLLRQAESVIQDAENNQTPEQPSDPTPSVPETPPKQPIYVSADGHLPIRVNVNGFETVYEVGFSLPESLRYEEFDIKISYNSDEMTGLFTQVSFVPKGADYNDPFYRVHFYDKSMISYTPADFRNQRFGIPNSDMYVCEIPLNVDFMSDEASRIYLNIVDEDPYDAYGIVKFKWSATPEQIESGDIVIDDSKSGSGQPIQ